MKLCSAGHLERQISFRHRAHWRSADVKRKFRVAAALTLATISFSSVALAQSAKTVPRETAPTFGIDLAYPYQLVPTTNIWTQLLLDTSTGQVWQIQFSLGNSPSARWVINDSSMLPQGETRKNGRFALYPTQNMYNFLLLDRQDSRIWQLQWSADAEKRGIVRSIKQDE
jgi:hypothetical protein